MSNFEMLKKLEHLVAFQASCTSDGNWEDFDKAENVIKELELQILTLCETD